MIKIRLKCFSQVKYALGKNEIIFELENGASTDDLEKIVRKEVILALVKRTKKRLIFGF